MKKFIVVLMVISMGLAVYNLIQIDFNDPFSKDSIVAVITFIAALCAFMVLAILRTAKKIDETVKKKR